MAVLAIQEQGALLGWRHGALVISLKGEVKRTLPPHDVEIVHLYGHVSLTPAARLALLGRGVDVMFFSSHGQYRGQLLSGLSKSAARRLKQYQYLSKPLDTLRLARIFVDGKLQNQRALLQRSNRGRNLDKISRAIESLERARRSAETSSDLDMLRGVEGHGAAVYFGALGLALKTNLFTFRTRTRRPPRDPVNSALSYAYMLLLRRVEGALRRAGIDPYLGALHATGRGKPSLALDMMEPLRPLVVDRMMLRLFNRKQELRGQGR